MVITTLMIPQNVYATVNNNSELLSELDKVADSEEKNSTAIMIAHRGMSSLAPENTIPAIEMAGLYGYGGVEFDVRETKDGKYVISHDPDVKRMTNGTGKISNMTLAQIKKLNIDQGNGIENYNGLKMATLEEALVCCREYNLIPCIEIKNIKNVKALLNIVKKYEYMNSATISSKKISIIQAIRKVNRKVSLNLISEGDGFTAVNTAINLKCNGIDLNYMKLNEKVVAYAKQNKMTVTAWTVDTLTDNYQCQKYGVDFITTDSMVDSNNLENLSVEKSYDVKEENINDGKMNQTDSVDSCIAKVNTWFEENDVTTVNVGNDMEYKYKMMEDDIAKGDVITITAMVNYMAGNHPYFTVYQNENMDCNVEDVNNVTGWHAVKLVYTAKNEMHMKVLFGMNENESGIFRMKNIQVSKLTRYQPESITMTASTLELSVGNIYNLQENIQSLDKKVIMKWKSTKEKIASVSESGCVTAKKVGKTNITITTENGKTSNCTVIVKPKKMSELKVAKKTTQKLELRWKKDSSATGYEIYCKEAGNKTYQLVKDIKKKSKTLVTFKNLNSSKKYYYKIRSYVKIDGKKYYGDFSKERSVQF